MKLSFIVPSNYEIEYKRKMGPSLGLAYISSVLKSNIDIEDINIGIEINELIRKKPDIVGIPIYTEDFKRAIEISKEIKKYLDIPIIAGGAHITALPETLPKTIDIGVIGEGEFATLELLQLYKKNALTSDKLKNIDGIVFHENKEKIITSPRKLCPLETLALPDRSIMKSFLPLENKNIIWEQGIYTSRGCPFKCTFCTHSILKNKVRFHSVEQIILDIQNIIKLFPEQKNIIIFDDLFVISKKRLKDISDAIISEKIHKKVSFGCMARASIFDEEICKLLKDMNVNVVSFGFESASEKVLSYLKVNSASTKGNQKAIDLCSKYGINVCGYFIIGSPIETDEDLSQSYWFIRKNLKDMPLVGTFCMTPVPKTKIWEYAQEKNFITKDFDDWNKVSYTDLIKDNYIFLNENYTYEYFHKAYKYFEYIFNRPERFPKIYQNQTKINNYKQTVIKDIQKYIFDKNILEIGEHKSYLSDLKENTKFISYNSFNDIDEKFDGIFINHVLEKIKNPFNFLKNLLVNLNKDGSIFILFYNSLLLSTLENLLKGFDVNTNIFQIRQFDFINLFSLSNFQKELKKRNINYQIIKKYKNTDFSYPYFLQTFDSKLDISSFKKEKDNFSYLIKIW